jgi:hypothetical protein
MAKRPVGLMWYYRTPAAQALRHNRIDHLVEDVPAHLFNVHIRAMLSRDHHCLHADRAVVFVTHRDLRFTVRPDPKDIADAIIDYLIRKENPHLSGQ